MLQLDESGVIHHLVPISPLGDENIVTHLQTYRSRHGRGKQGWEQSAEPSQLWVRHLHLLCFQPAGQPANHQL